jgi:hypothetical protein
VLPAVLSALTGLLLLLARLLGAAALLLAGLALTATLLLLAGVLLIRIIHKSLLFVTSNGKRVWHGRVPFKSLRRGLILRQEPAQPKTCASLATALILQLAC